MDWWPFNKSSGTTTSPTEGRSLLHDIEQRAKQYLDDTDNGRLIYPACKRNAVDPHGDEAAIAVHTRLEAFRYLLAVPRREFTLLADPDVQLAVFDGYLRQLPHDQTVIEFTGNSTADLAIATIAGFNWINHCAVLASADRALFHGTLNHFRRVASSAQRWWSMEGARQRAVEMIAAGQEPPLFLNLIWADYGRLAKQVAAAAHVRAGVSPRAPQ